MNRTEALIASDSFDWRERLGSIAYIGGFDDDECRRAMVRLLTDSDIAVCNQAGKFLVQRNDVKAAELLFIGIAVSYEQQRAATLWEIRNEWVANRFDLDRFTQALLSDGNFLVRSGVHDVLKWLELE